jgi:hypothetical protein
MARRFSENKVDDRSKLEVSRLRWLEDVQNDLRELNMKTGSPKAKSVVTKMKVLRGS